MPRPTVMFITNTCDKETPSTRRPKLITGGRSAKDRLPAQSLADRAWEAGLASGSMPSEPDVFRSRRVTIRKQFQRGTQWPRLEQIAPLRMGACATQRATLPGLHLVIHWAEDRITSRSVRLARLGKQILQAEECGHPTRVR